MPRRVPRLDAPIDEVELPSLKRDPPKMIQVEFGKQQHARIDVTAVNCVAVSSVRRCTFPVLDRLNQESPRAAGRIVDDVVRFWLDKLNHHPDNILGSKVYPQAAP